MSKMQNKMHNKRQFYMHGKGQFYVLSALILIGVAFALVQGNKERLARPKLGLSQLADNFRETYPSVVNNAIFEQKNITAQFNAYVKNFALYGNGKEPGFGIITILVAEKDITVYNAVGEEIKAEYQAVEYQETKILKDGAIIGFANDKGKITIGLDDIDYAFDIGEQEYQVKALFRSTQNDNVQIQTIK